MTDARFIRIADKLDSLHEELSVQRHYADDLPNNLGVADARDRLRAIVVALRKTADEFRQLANSE